MLSSAAGSNTAFCGEFFQCHDLPIAVIGLAWRADRLARSSRQFDSDWSRVTDPLFVIGTVPRQVSAAVLISDTIFLLNSCVRLL